jgi:hypothetical protein
MTLIIQKPTTSKLILAKDYVGIDDPDAAAYIAAVEAADEAESPGVGALETATKVAIHSFVKGCKADGIWPAIKASCILSGARTLIGALVPLVGTAPTNPFVNPADESLGRLFVSGDYNRKTGLVGNGSTKYLDSNRNTNSDPQNNQHFSVYLSAAGSPSSSTQLYMGGSSSTGGLSLGIASSQQFSRSQSISFILTGSSSSTGLAAASRSLSASYIHRSAGSNSSLTAASQTPANSSIFVFRESPAGGLPTNARLAFYSIGESLDLALLDARVTTLINAFAAAIP